jgi:hypothetical protein
MFVEGEAYLASVSKPLGLTQVNHIASKSVSDVRAALFAQLKSYMANKFNVPVLLTDGEGAINAIKEDKHLVFYAVRCLNLMPCRT